MVRCLTKAYGPSVYYRAFHSTQQDIVRLPLAKGRFYLVKSPEIPCIWFMLGVSFCEV